MHICFLFENYPYKNDPRMPFTRALVVELAKLNIQCSVISPQSISSCILNKYPIRPSFWEDIISDTIKINVYQPYCITFSNLSRHFNFFSMSLAIRSVFKRIKNNIDVLYCHFWHMGVIASIIQKDLPIFVACGESRIEVYKDFSRKQIDDLLNKLIGIIYVGSKSYQDSIDQNLQQKQPYIIAPNGYNPAEFKNEDRARCREKLHWPSDKCIISFVGSFNERKGVNRLSDAIDQIDDEIYSVFIGDGKLKPKCKNILFSGKLEHSMISTYLNASDYFVLPTNNEGCCNAIVEALACGLPVISSNQSFNADILDDSCSIKIDPMNISEIKDAIITLQKNADLRNKLSSGALKKAETLSLPNRAKAILEFILNHIARD